MGRSHGPEGSENNASEDSSLVSRHIHLYAHRTDLDCIVIPESLLTPHGTGTARPTDLIGFWVTGERIFGSPMNPISLPEPYLEHDRVGRNEKGRSLGCLF